jgi:hypothetical protein
MRREADVLACLADTVVAPAGPLPPVGETDVREFATRFLAAAPGPNRAGLRAALLALEAGPRLLGFGGRMRTLPRERRTAYLDRLGRTPIEPLVHALCVVAAMAYYGDPGPAQVIGYDAEANVARGRALRAAEGRW